MYIILYVDHFMYSLYIVKTVYKLRVFYLSIYLIYDDDDDMMTIYLYKYIYSSSILNTHTKYYKLHLMFIYLYPFYKPTSNFFKAFYALNYIILKVDDRKALPLLFLYLVVLRTQLIFSQFLKSLKLVKCGCL